MSILVLLPAFLAAYIAATQSPQRALLMVYVPVLLFLPNYYYWILNGLPDPNFNQATILAIAIVWLIKGASGWRFSFTDILVVGFAFTVSYSEYDNAGFKELKNLGFDVVGSILLPYVLAKSLIEQQGLREEFAKQIALVLCFVALLMLPQFITGANYSVWQKVLGRFFDGQGWQWATTYRWGLTRASGPYGHPILAGIILLIGYRLQRWLEWGNYWPKRIRLFAGFSLSPKIISFGILAGAIMTITRGPLMAGVVAAVIVMIGKSKQRWLVFMSILVLTITIGIPLVAWFVDYASVDRQSLEYGSAQETIVYRWELLEIFIDIGKEKLWWGWGRKGWIHDELPHSIDNYYLLLFLQHGIMGLGFLVAIFTIMITRLFIRGMTQPITNSSGNSFEFALLSVYVVMSLSIATVWLGEQTVPVLFFLMGWTESALRYQSTIHHTTMIVPTHHFRFQRILQ